MKKKKRSSKVTCFYICGRCGRRSITAGICPNCKIAYEKGCFKCKCAGGNCVCSFD